MERDRLHGVLAELVLVLGFGVVVMRDEWRIVLVTPAQEPEPIVIGVNCVVGGCTDEAESANVLIRQAEGNHLVDL